MGMFRWKGRGGLEFLSKGEMMKGLRYRQLFDEKLDIFMQFHDTSHFLQDGALCHKDGHQVVQCQVPQLPHQVARKLPRP